MKDQETPRPPSNGLTAAAKRDTENVKGFQKGRRQSKREEDVAKANAKFQKKLLEKREPTNPPKPSKLGKGDRQ